VIVSVKLPPEFAKKALSAKQRNHSHFLIGSYGEQLAKNFLVKNKFSIVGQNIRWKQYEADIIAQDKNTGQLVIVEVKTRKNTLVAPHLAVSSKKIKNMHLFASLFVRLHYKHFREYLEYRIDAICIADNKISHFKNITWW
jgi:putative endonuclease